RCLVNVHANILFLIHDGAPFARVGDSNNHNLSQKWAPFYIACNRDISPIDQWRWEAVAAFGEGQSNAVDFVGFGRGPGFVVAIARKVTRKL
ncbi:MAG: hypothetical protein WA372_23310, partial [Candidatus Sulfotelmatobacter sp.]